MNIAVIQLSCNRNNLTVKCILQNYFNSGKDADVFLIDNGSDSIEDIKNVYPHFKKIFQFKKNEGVAKAINKGLSLTKKYDAVVTLANDILMPNGWLASLDKWAEKITNTGMAGIHCVESLPPLSDKGVHEIYCPFGNTLITRMALDKIGGFNTDFGIYGMEDTDFAHRLHYAGGFVNYYIPDLKSEHIGHDVGDGTEYRKLKDESLAKSGMVLTKALERYKDGDYMIQIK